MPKAVDPSSRAQALYVFGEFELDPELRVLRRNGRALALTATSMRVLLCLVESRGRVVSKRELTEVVWPNGGGAPNSLSQALWEIRRALREQREDPTVIETVRGYGYRFLPAAERVDPARPRGPARLASPSQLDLQRLRALLDASGHGSRGAFLARRIGQLDPEDLLTVLEFVWLVAQLGTGADASTPRRDVRRSAS